jgi:hypothetical protein
MDNVKLQAHLEALKRQVETKLLYGKLGKRG